MKKRQVKRKSPTNSEEDSGKHILVVDDEESILDVIADGLTKHGYHVATATTGAAAWRAVNTLPVHLIILDVLLGDEDGMEMLEKFKKTRPSIPVIIITGFGYDDELMRTATEKGASGFISKTSPLDQLLQKVEGTLKPELVRAVTPADEEACGRAAPSAAAEPVSPPQPAPAAPSQAAPAPTTEPAHEAAPVRSADSLLVAAQISVAPDGERFDFGMEVFARMLAAYHPNLGNTAARAVAFCGTLGKVMQLPSNQLRNLLWAAALHDVALVRIDRGIISRWMRNPGKCSAEEIALIRRHPAQSQDMLTFCPVFKEAGEIIRAHHEDWDGTGYPDGLKMETIPWLARLLAVVIDYCSRNSPDSKAVKEIEAQANKRYDPQAVEAVLNALTQVTLPRGGRELMSYELKPGMVLAADVVNRDGVLVLGKDTELTGAKVAKLVHYGNAGEIDTHILVYC